MDGPRRWRAERDQDPLAIWVSADVPRAAVGRWEAVGRHRPSPTLLHLHVLLTNGVFRRDGTFVPLPPHEPTVLEEAWRRAVLAWFVRQGWLEQDDAAGSSFPRDPGFPSLRSVKPTG
jgi:hypothetical protein